MSKEVGVALSRAIDHANQVDEEREKKDGGEFGYDVHYAGQQVKPLPAKSKGYKKFSDQPGSWIILVLLRELDNEYPVGLNPT